MHKYVIEAIGTFFIAIAIGLSGNALAIGLMLSAMIYGGIHVSGAHYNPAVSFAFFIKRKINLNTFIGYFLSQSLGAFAAAGIILFLSKQVYFVEPPISTDIYQQGAVELLLSLVLIFSYLNIASAKILPSNRTYGLILGLIFAGLIYLGEPISGGVYNPALSIGYAIVDYLAIQGESYKFIPLYTLAPFAGGVLAAFLYQYLDD